MLLPTKRVFQAVNTELIDLYWQVGATISHKIKAAEWGDGVVERLAAYIAKTQPGLRGFTRANLFRMRQFYETYQTTKKSHHWCDNCRGRTTSSSWDRANVRKSVSFYLHRCCWLCPEYIHRNSHSIDHCFQNRTDDLFHAMEAPKI